jgi:hypothetical protein
LQPLQGREAIQTGHLQIEQQDIRLKLLQNIQYLPAILSLRHDVEIIFQRQQLTETIPEDGVIVGHNDADLGFGRHPYYGPIRTVFGHTNL